MSAGRALAVAARVPVVLALALALVLALGGCGDGDGGSPGPEDLDVTVEDGVEVGIVDFGFEPAEVEVTAGEAVVWTNEGDATHTVTGDAFDSGEQVPDDEFRYVTSEDEAGEVLEYGCTIHPAMRGTVTVR